MPRETGRYFGLSLLQESSYGVPIVPATAPKNFEQIAKEGYPLAKYTPTPVTNDGFATGTDYATKSAVSKHDVTQDFRIRSTSQELGRRLLDAFGDYSVVLVAAGVYLHTFKPLKPQSEADLGSRTYVEKTTEPALDTDIIHDVLYPGMKCNSLALESPASPDENGAYLMCNTSYIGSGKQLGSPVAAQTGSNVNFEKAPSHVVLDADKAENFFLATTGQLKLYPNANQGGTVQDVGCDFRGFTLNHLNNLLEAQGYQGCGKYQVQTNPNSGAVRGSLPKGKAQTDISFMALVSKAFAQIFNPFKRFREQSVFSAELAWLGALIANVAGTDYFHFLKVKMNKLTINDVTYDATDTLDMYSISANTLAAGSVQPFEIQLQNNIPSYLTL